MPQLIEGLVGVFAEMLVGEDDLAVAEAFEANRLDRAPGVNGGRNVDIGDFFAFHRHRMQNHGIAAKFLIDAPA